MEQQALFACRHGEREDYAWFNRGDNWQAVAKRPWDTPLTAAGHAQAAALGQSLAVHLATLGSQPVATILCSPLLRCVQTACAIAEACGVEKVAVEPGLVETMCEEWYRSWAISGADSTWGKTGDVDASLLHPAASQPAGLCHAAPREMELMRRDHFLVSPLGSKVTLDASYVPVDAGSFEYTWPNFESEDLQAARMARVAEFAATLQGSALLVSHGGPTSNLYKTISRRISPACGYCGLYGYTREGEEWAPKIVANHDHLALIDAPSGGPNDFDEQHHDEEA